MKGGIKQCKSSILCKRAKAAGRRRTALVILLVVGGQTIHQKNNELTTHNERRYKTMSWNSDADHCDADYDNHANQLNPNNDEYDHCREGNDD